MYYTYFQFHNIPAKSRPWQLHSCHIWTRRDHTGKGHDPTEEPGIEFVGFDAVTLTLMIPHPTREIMSKDQFRFEICPQTSFFREPSALIMPVSLPGHQKGRFCHLGINSRYQWCSLLISGAVHSMPSVYRLNFR